MQASHSRRQPAAERRVGWPHLAQKRWRACQSAIRLGCAEDRHRLGRDEPLHGDRAHVYEFEIVAAGHVEFAAVEEAVAVIGALLDGRVRQEGREMGRAVAAEAQQDFGLRRPQTLGERAGPEGLARRRGRGSACRGR